MSNLDVAVSSFWQLARHWKQGDKAKLELSCEDGSLHMQLSALLGHPDQPHFSHPPPPPQHAPSPPLKKKSPSQLRRQERRKREAEARADKAASEKESISEDDEKRPSTVASNVKETEIVIEANTEEPAVKLTNYDGEETHTKFKCTQCDYIHNTDKGLKMHIRMKHRISQVDGMNDTDEEDSEDNDIITLELDNLGHIIGPKLPPNTLPPLKVKHPKPRLALDSYSQNDLPWMKTFLPAMTSQRIQRHIL